MIRCLVRTGVVVFVAACASERLEEVTAPGCADCVDLEMTAELDFSNAPTLPSAGGLLTRSEVSGAWVFVDRSVPSELLVFDSDGRFSHVVGGEGSGPGEFQRISNALFDSFDTLWVVSRFGRRVDLYDSTYEWVRGMPLESRVMRAVPMADGRVLALTSEGGAPQLSWISRGGVVQPVEHPTLPSVSAELVSLASDGANRFWIAEPHAYRVWQGGVEGEATLLLDGAPAWFGEDFGEEVKEEFGDFLDTGGATIQWLSPGSDGNSVWLLAGVPSSGLEADFLRGVFESQDRGMLEEVPARIIDHVLQRVSTESGESHGQGRFDYISFHPASSILYDVDEEGMVRVLSPEVR